MVPKVNALAARYQTRGLSVVGVTGAEAGPTEAWAKRLEVAYPYGYDSDFTLAGPFNVSVLPIAILVDSAGIVVYHGAADGLSEAAIRKAMDGALARPITSWPAEFASVRKACLAGEFGAAKDALTKLTGDKVAGAGAVAADLEKLTLAAIQTAERSLAGGDVLGAQERAGRLVEQLAGRPEIPRLKALLEKIESDAGLERVLEGQIQVRLYTAQAVPDRGTAEAVVEGLDELATEYAGTLVERLARAHILYVQRVMPHLPTR